MMEWVFFTSKYLTVSDCRVYFFFTKNTNLVCISLIKEENMSKM